MPNIPNTKPVDQALAGNLIPSIKGNETEQVNLLLINHAFDEVTLIYISRNNLYNPVPEKYRNFRFKWIQKIVNFIFQEAD